MPNLFKVDIYTPFGLYYSKEVELLEVRNDKSVVGVLAHHTPLISTVNLGMIRIKRNGRFRVFATTGGIINVKKDGTVSLMLHTIEREDEIDINRAKLSLERARKHLEDKDGDIKRAQAAIDRATNRLQIAKGLEDKDK